MAKLSTIISMLFTIVMAMPWAQGIDESPKAVEHWFKEKLPHAKEKLTKLHFYFHDTVSGKNPTTIPVAQANITRNSPTSFGYVVVIDDPLTVGPEPNSKILGRARGIYVSASQEEVRLTMVLNYVFTEGKYNDSTLSILASNPVFHKYREMAILGGTGVFRLARGIATSMTHIVNSTSGDAIVEYFVEVLHYV